MNSQNTTVNLLRIWRVFKKLWYVVVILTLVGAGIVYYHTKTTSVPVYTAYATLYATQLNDSGQYTTATGQQVSSVNASDLSLRTLLLNDCIYLSTSDVVLNQTNEVLLEQGYSKVSAGQISASIVEDTRYFTLSLTTSNPEQSNKGLMELCTALQEQTVRIIQVDNIEKISQINATAPIMASPLRESVKGAGVGFVIGFGLLLLIVFTDRTIKNEEDFESVFPKINVIGTIPEFDLNAERNAAKKRERQIGEATPQSTHHRGHRTSDKGGEE